MNCHHHISDLTVKLNIASTLLFIIRNYVSQIILTSVLFLQFLIHVLTMLILHGPKILM